LLASKSGTRSIANCTRISLAACVHEHVTPYMWLHAAFQTFLHRYTGHSDIVVGSGIANRRPAESQQLLGMMINTVAMRTDFAGDPIFRDVLARFRRAAVLAIDNQDAPYEKVIQRLNPATDLFNCFFDSYDQAFAAYRTEDVRVESVDGIGNGTCKFDLIALVIPGDGAPTLLWEYSTDLFTRPAAERMMRHFLALVASSVGPNRPAGEPAADAVRGRTRPPAAIGTRAETVLPGERIERIFAVRVAASPDADAVLCGGERLSYADLDRRAEALAHRLRTAGVVPGGRRRLGRVHGEPTRSRRCSRF
jgi:non-ribosomal peptide synthetase component F